jgi:hypothetical protein
MLILRGRDSCVAQAICRQCDRPRWVTSTVTVEPKSGRRRHARKDV